MHTSLSKPLIYGSGLALVVVSHLITGWLVFRFAPRPPLTLAELETKYPYIDISRHLIPSEHFIVNLQPLREKLFALTDPLPKNSVTVYMEFLNTGANISINNDTKMWPASLAKLPLAMAVTRKVQDGTWQMSNELAMMPQDRDASWGTLYKDPIGTTYTIEKLLTELLTKSDNTAFKILYRNMTSDELESIIEEVGLKELFNEEGKIGSKDYSRLLRALYNSSYLSRDNSQWILGLLNQSTYDEYLRQPLPKEVPFAHKIGENQDVQVVSDAGIVFIEHRPYLLTVMIDRQAANIDREFALDLMHQISKESYEYISNVQKPD